MLRRQFLQGLPALAGLAIGCGRPERAPFFHSIDITGNAEFKGDFQLVDHDGHPRSMADYRGKLVTLFFGYLNCPDFCPTHLARQNEVLRLLGDQALRVQTLFVSVDPERDTPERIKAYVTAFNPGFVGLTGGRMQIDEAARAFKASYSISAASGSAMGYTVNHSTLSYAFDPLGRLRLAVRHELSAANVADDLRQLL
ncbi:SCO family protein [Viridibacterium curvum]|uniref:SCO family protein n=1 Tax=Viridibacterium curvum TaxID=1101404 RepID=A0ABP9R830_9RHOO